MGNHRDLGAITVPTEFAVAIARDLCDEPVARLTCDSFPFMDLPMSVLMTLYEPPGATLAHLTDQGKESPSADGGRWILLGEDGLDELADTLANGAGHVEAVRGDSRFRDVLAGEFLVPSEDAIGNAIPADGFPDRANSADGGGI